MNDDLQTHCYSGKSKQHAIKNVIVIEADRHIAFLSETYGGSVHDKTITDEAAYTFPKGSILYQDRGFQGYTCADVTIAQPKKKPQGGTLTATEKAINRQISGVRVHVEHAIRGVKRQRIIAEIIRIFCYDFRDKVMETCCGLYNFINQRRRIKILSKS